MLLALMPSMTTAQITNTITVDVRDWQDGRDWLILSGSTVQWQHFDYDIPGVEGGHDDPTWITTTFNGITNLNSYAWYPTWTNGASPGFSSTFANLLPSLPSQTPSNIQMQIIAARESMTLIQEPSATNAYTTIVEFDDDMQLGPDYYEVLLSYSFVAASNPPPGLDIGFYAGLLITAPIGSTNRIDYTDDISQANWLPLTNIVITESPYFYCDQDSRGKSRRFYRAVTLP